MSTLRVYLSPLNHGSLRVTTDPFSETDSTMPFGGSDSWRVTLLKALNTDYFEPKDFQKEGEQNWMITESLLADNGDYRTFHPNMRENIGRELYKCLFPHGGETRETLQREWHNAKKSQEQLHLQIAIKYDVARQARLFDYPWELMHDDRGFLAAQQIAISRHIEFEDPLPNIPALDRINVLLVSSKAVDIGLEPLTDDEYNAVYEVLQQAKQRGQLHLVDELKHVTSKSLEDYVIDHREENTPYIIHFDGHGQFGVMCKNFLPGVGECSTFHPGIVANVCRKCGAKLGIPEGYLLFEDDLGGARYVSAKRIGQILGLANQSNQPGRGIALVILSACKSSMAQVADSVFNGVAQSLVSHLIPAVVGMAFLVNTKSATNFAERFYHALGERLPLALAMNWGRLAMDYDSNQWYRPVLYLRWKDNQGGQIFARQHENDLVVRNTKEGGATKQIDHPRSNPSGNLHLAAKATPEDGKMLNQSSSVLVSATTYYKEIKTKQIQLIPVYLLFGFYTVEDIPLEHYKVVAQSPLFGIEDIWPEHCKLAIRSLLNIAHSVQELYELLDNAPKQEYKVEVIQLHSALMGPIDLCKDHLKNLISLISKFKEICRTSSRNILNLRQDIKDHLESLRENLNKVSAFMDSYC